MYNRIFKGTYTCSVCNGSHNYVAIDDSTVIKEFSANYYITPHSGCCWTEEERFCTLVKWEDFVKSPEVYINNAFDKRQSEIAKKVKVYPK